MSIWGKKVDSFFTQGGARSRDDYNRAGLNALWQVALVLLVAAVLVLAAKGLGA